MEWNYPEVAQSMFSLVKSGGFFKSIKQRNFLRAPRGFPWHVVVWDFDNIMRHSEETIKFFRENFGIADANTTDTLVTVEGSIRWADYGRRSTRRVMHIFILDDYGVRSQHKIKFTYDDSHGSSGVDGSKTVEVWSRDPSVELPVFVEPAKPEVIPGNWIGDIKQRMVFEGNITFAREIGYSQWGTTYMTIVKIGNDEVVYWGLLDHIDYRGPIKFKATVKSHELYNERKQTVVNRPAVCPAS
jgi:hypothetical protein